MYPSTITVEKMCNFSVWPSLVLVYDHQLVCPARPHPGCFAGRRAAVVPAGVLPEPRHHACGLSTGTGPGLTQGCGGDVRDVG